MILFSVNKSVTEVSNHSLSFYWILEKVPTFLELRFFIQLWEFGFDTVKAQTGLFVVLQWVCSRHVHNIYHSVVLLKLHCKMWTMWMVHRRVHFCLSTLLLILLPLALSLSVSLLCSLSCSCSPALSLPHTHTYSHSFFSVWTRTITPSLSFCLYEWWPSPALDRKEDRSHLNSATPLLLNQAPQCHHPHTHTHTRTHCVPLSITLTQEGHSSMCVQQLHRKIDCLGKNASAVWKKNYCSKLIIWSLIFPANLKAHEDTRKLCAAPFLSASSLKPDVLGVRFIVLVALTARKTSEKSDSKLETTLMTREGTKTKI